MSRQARAGVATLAMALTLAAPLAAHAADAMRVVLDPKTGELRPPNAAEVLAFEKAEAQLRSARGQKAGAAPAAKSADTEVRYADGTVQKVLGEDTHLYSVVSADADGKLNYDCLPAKEAQQFVKSGPRKSAASVKATAKVHHDHQ